MAQPLGLWERRPKNTPLPLIKFDHYSSDGVEIRRGVPKILAALGSLGMGAWLTSTTRPSPYVLKCKIWLLWFDGVVTSRGRFQTNLGALGL